MSSPDGPEERTADIEERFDADFDSLVFAEDYERDIDDAVVAEQLADDDHDTRHEIPYSGWAVHS